MSRLVVLSEGFTGLSHELKGEKTTVGRLEDNAFQIAEPSVSSHHCEVSQSAQGLVVRDLNSTNGTYIDGNSVTEAVLKPGQILRLGQVELRLETGPGGAPVAPPPPPKKALDKTMVLSQGVKASELDPANRPAAGPAAAFPKKSNRENKIFIAIGVALGVVIIVLLILAWQRMS